jgi:hypothetical protein
MKMSEEVIQEEVAPEAPIPKPKQYLVMVDEITMAILGKIMPGLLFVQVEGMAMQGNDNHMLLVNPVVKPPVPTVPVEGIKPEEV